jgi:hypothetical protein
VFIAVLVRALLPLAAELLRDEDVQSSCERQHEGQNVSADMIVEDLSKIRHHHGMCDQLRIIVASGGGGLWRLQPPQFRRLRQQVMTEPAESCLGIEDLTRGGVGVFRHDHVRLWHGFRQTFPPVASGVSLRRQHDELE